MKRSHDHTQLKRLAAISLVLVMCLSSLAAVQVYVVPSPAALALGAMNGTTDRHITRHNEIAARRVS